MTSICARRFKLCVLALVRQAQLVLLRALAALRQAGQDYPLNALSPAQFRLAADFIDLGLLFQRKQKSTRFYTTHIAVNLIFGASAGNLTR